MINSISAITTTRALASEIISRCMVDIDAISEASLRDRILFEMAQCKDVFDEGWYSPPPGGVAVLSDTEPFERLQFQTLRNATWWPTEASQFSKETVAVVYLSPVEKSTGMIGDFGFTFYQGDNIEIKEHIRTCYDAILSVAEHAKVGMSFAELFANATSAFEQARKGVNWMKTISDPLKGINLGHTVPGTYGDDFRSTGTFEEIKNEITTKRVYINVAENFVIPETCAFTVEARLADLDNPDLPNVFFHFIVTFSEGKKEILKNFEEVFKTANMDYI